MRVTLEFTVLEANKLTNLLGSAIGSIGYVLLQPNILPAQRKYLELIQKELTASSIALASKWDRTKETHARKRR